MRVEEAPKAARAAKRRKVAAGAASPGPMVGPDGAVDWGDLGPPLALEDGGGLATGEFGAEASTRAGRAAAGAGPWMAAPLATGRPPSGGMERLRHALLGAELAGPLAAELGRESPGSSGRLGGEDQRGRSAGSGPAGSGDRPPSDGEPRPAASSDEAVAAAAGAAAAATALAEEGDIFLPAVPEEDGEGGGPAAVESTRFPAAATAADAAAAARHAAAINPATRAVVSLLRAYAKTEPDDLTTE
jgi:hypothetical protein